MSNYLIFKAIETKSIDTLETNLPNYEITQSYTNYKEITATILASGTLDLGDPETLQSTIPFVVLISDTPVDLTFKDSLAATITSLKTINYLAGNIKGYSFSLTNSSTISANITYRIYW